MAYFRPVPDDAPDVQEVPTTMLVPTWILSGSSIYFGINTDLTVGVAKQAATVLFGGGG